MHSTTSYKDDFAKIVPLPNIQRMSRNKKKPFYSPQNLEAMVTGTTYKQDFGSWKVWQTLTLVYVQITLLGRYFNLEITLH